VTGEESKMVNELGSVSSLHVATPQVFASPRAAFVRMREGGDQSLWSQAGLQDRPASFSRFAQLSAIQDARWEAALQLRQAGSSLERTDAILTEIKSRLLEIVKQYPPFRHDDPRRVEYLNAIPGLRKQLDALSFPPVRMHGDGQEALPRAAYPAEGDLAIPELDPRTASDTEVATALDAVTRAQGKLEAMRANMWQDVVEFVGALDADQAENQVRTVRDYIASNPGPGIGAGARQLLSAGV
jgi:hypothetical protein